VYKPNKSLNHQNQQLANKKNMKEWKWLEKMLKEISQPDEKDLLMIKNEFSRLIKISEAANWRHEMEEKLVDFEIAMAQIRQRVSYKEEFIGEMKVLIEPINNLVNNGEIRLRSGFQINEEFYDKQNRRQTQENYYIGYELTFKQGFKTNKSNIKTIKFIKPEKSYLFNETHKIVVKGIFDKMNLFAETTKKSGIGMRVISGPVS
jgi:hypothetical protein